MIIGGGTDQSRRPVELLPVYGEERARRHDGEERGGQYHGSDQLEGVQGSGHWEEGE